MPHVENSERASPLLCRATWIIRDFKQPGQARHIHHRILNCPPVGDKHRILEIEADCILASGVGHDDRLGWR
jgi:hypothetical protein